MNKFNNDMKTPSGILILFAVLAIIPLLILCRYVYPVNDDFSFALQHMEMNCIESVIDSWNNWSGRFFATFISSLNPFVISSEPVLLFRIYSIAIVFMFSVVIICVPLLAVRKYLMVSDALGFGALMMLVYIAFFPSVSQAFFWFSSYTAYTIPSLLFLILLFLLCRKDKFSIFLSCLLALIVPGGNEVTAVLTVCTMAYIYWVYKERRFYVITLISVISIVIVILSPGNGVRMSHQLSAHPYIWTLVVSIVQTFSWLILWGPLLLLASLIYIPLYGHRIAKCAIFDVSFKKFVIAFVITILLAHVPPTLGLSSVMIDRTANCLLMFVIPGYFYGLNILLNKYETFANMASKLFANQYVLGSLLFCFLFIGPFSMESPCITAVTDILTNKAGNYASIQNKRILLAQKAENGEIVQLPSLGLTAKSLYVKDLDIDPYGEFSRDFCKIYGSNGYVFVGEEEVLFEDNFTSLKKFNKNTRASQ